MPKVWYPFAPDHEHAGKYYEGLAPEGNLEALQKLGKFVTTRPTEVVEPCDVVRAELKNVMEEFAAITADLAAIGKASLASRYKRSVEAFAPQVEACIAAGGATQARLQLERIEREVAEAGKLLGGMVPWAGQAPAVTPAQPTSKSAK